MTGRTQDVDEALFLRRFHVPCWAVAHVFGRDAMYWYRLEQGLGRCSGVGTTVKSPEHLPKDLVADEKHSWLKGERVYIATTAAQDCILGASVAPSASQAALEKAGRHLRRDSLSSILYAEELNSITISATRQTTDRRHEILDQKSTDFQVAL